MIQRNQSAYIACIIPNFKVDNEHLVFITGAQPKAGTGHKMQTVSVVFSTLHCLGYIADLRYIAGSLLLGVLAGSLNLKSTRHGGQSRERL